MNTLTFTKSTVLIWRDRAFLAGVAAYRFEGMLVVFQHDEQHGTWSIHGSTGNGQHYRWNIYQDGRVGTSVPGVLRTSLADVEVDYEYLAHSAELESSRAF